MAFRGNPSRDETYNTDAAVFQVFFLHEGHEEHEGLQNDLNP
jgi:uncharacterized pyridoxamine 5'-phosphate oxidase family protein